jgi:hypothetical protein
MTPNWLLAIRRPTTGSPDSHGNATETLGDPEDWWVWGVAPGDNVEPGQPNRERSDVVWTVFAPADGYGPTAQDVVVVDEKDFQVDGEPEDWTRGPWGPGNAGLVVKLKRMEG